MIDLFYNALGLAGTACFLLAYLLLQMERLSAKALSYSVLNFAGAILILISLLHAWNLPAFLLELAWGVISLAGIIRCLKDRS